LGSSERDVRRAVGPPSSQTKRVNVTQRGGALSVGSNLASTAALTGPSMAGATAAWYAILTIPRHEKKVNAELGQKGIYSLLPLISEHHQWSDRSVAIDMPLFPGYAFVRIPQEQASRIAVLRTAGVRGFVGMRGLGDPIPDSQIAGIRTVLSTGTAFDLCSFPSVGQRVRVRGGSFEGVEGVLTAINGDQSLVLAVDLIQRSLAIRVTGFRIEPV
jgi:transcription antitermination factor NusG